MTKFKYAGHIPWKCIEINKEGMKNMHYQEFPFFNKRITNK